MNQAISALRPAAGRIIEVLIGAVGGGWLVGKANKKTNVAPASLEKRGFHELKTTYLLET